MIAYLEGTVQARLPDGVVLLTAGGVGYRVRLPTPLLADVPESGRSALEILRTDTATFQELIESRRNRHEEWFQTQAGRIEICNVPIPVRTKNAGAK